MCDSLTATDASYLVEPVDGLWLLAIDGGVYLPKEMKDGKWTYQGSSAGYNLVLKHKPLPVALGAEGSRRSTETP